MAQFAGRQRRTQRPPPLGIVRADRQGNAAGLRPRQAQIDVLKGPLPAVALVVDGEIAILETDLAQILAIEPAGAEAVNPGDERSKIRDHTPYRRSWRIGALRA